MSKKNKETVKKNKAASIIELLKKKTKIDLSFVDESIWVKKISYVDGELFVQGESDEAQILYHSCLYENGFKFFADLKQAEEFLAVCPLTDVNKIIDASGAYVIPDKELAKN